MANTGRNPELHSWKKYGCRKYARKEALSVDDSIKDERAIGIFQIKLGPSQLYSPFPKQTCLLNTSFHFLTWDGLTFQSGEVELLQVASYSENGIRFRVMGHISRVGYPVTLQSP